MAVTTAMCNSYKQEILKGVHLDTHNYKIALIKNGAAGTFDKSTTSYTGLGTDEHAGGGATGYVAGGLLLSGFTVALTSDVASIDWADAVWNPSNISAIGAIVYNDSVVGKPAVCVINFADTVSVPVISSNAAFTAQIPSSGTGLVRVGP